MVRDILRAVSRGVRRATNICREANVPMDRGRRFLDLMVENGLLIRDEVSREYLITPTGYEWLGIYKRLQEILPLA